MSAFSLQQAVDCFEIHPVALSIKSAVGEVLGAELANNGVLESQSKLWTLLGEELEQCLSVMLILLQLV